MKQHEVKITGIVTQLDKNSPTHHGNEYSLRATVFQNGVAGKGEINIPISGEFFNTSVCGGTIELVGTISLKPTPTLRAWNLDEVPVGAIVRQKANHQNRLLITGVSDGMVWSGKINREFDECSEWAMCKCEHSIDSGKTWHPCGLTE